MQTLELLSPAKNLESGICAIDHGADAVYIGADKFGARAAAGNSLEDISVLCRYAHTYNAKVYVTVNTIIYNNEIDTTTDLCQQLQDIGVDAILIQDMGLFSYLSSNLSIQLHASTQTDNRTIEKVRWLAGLGFKRVVLARELSLKEIEEIHQQVPDVELEVFVHGALCVSYSGQCYASQHCFKRSANRGECAQFCRMPFTLKDADNKVITTSSHLLSLKDLALLQNLEQLAEAGACSFKIEGRLKNIDYVKNITAAYSERLNELCKRYPDKYKRTSMGKCTYTFKPDIYKTFNRGYTTYFIDGRQPDMSSPETPKSIGEYIGKVKDVRPNCFIISTEKSLHNGDGLCFVNTTNSLVGFRVNRVEGNKVFPLKMSADIRKGISIYRNHDQSFHTLISKPSSVRKIEISLSLIVDTDSLTLQMTDESGATRKISEPYVYTPSIKQQDENICKQLTKLGNTPYICKDINIEYNCDKPFIPNSTLAKLRRDLLESSDNTTRIKEAASSPVKETLPPQYSQACLYNASNEKSKSFYSKYNIDADSFETNAPERKLLMQCRFCLKHEMGYCSKLKNKTPWREPLRLSLDDGQSFDIVFNCKNCQMEIWA